VTVLARVVRELAGLFVEDGLLAIFVLGIVAAAAIASLRSGLWAGCLLLAGSLCALFVNVIVAVRRHRFQKSAECRTRVRPTGAA
jgi:hypothetical protein